MSSVINTNIMSLNSQRQLTKSQDAMATALTRLSSGLRINSAKDDAAGMAISERFTTQINGNTQAARNANDAISLSQTAEGAMNEITTNLQRIRQLAVQSLNATNSASDRTSMNAEVTQLKAEIERVASTTSFNGVKLLDGNFTAQTFQVGANSGETITIDAIASMRTSALGAGLSTTKTSTAVTTALGATDLIINGKAIGASVATGSVATGLGADSGIAIANAINAASGTNVVATANATSVTGGVPTFAGNIAANAFQINGVNVGAVTAGANAVAQGAAVAAAINLVSAASGVSATANGTTGAITLNAADGRNIIVGGTVTDTGLTAATTRGTITMTSTDAAGITVAGANPAYAGLTAGTTASSSTGSSLASIDILSVANSNTTLATIDSALTTLNGARGAMGAYQNRFTSVVNNLATTTENLSAARSRIQDADFASETASLTRAQILQQAGTAMLAQANQAPNTVLSLLK